MTPEEAAKAAVVAIDAAIPGVPLSPALVQVAAQVVLAAVSGLKGAAVRAAEAEGLAWAAAKVTDVTSAEAAAVERNK